MAKTGRIGGLLLGAFCVCVTGCASLTVGTDRDPPQLRSRGIVNAYVACNGFRPYDGRVVNAGIFPDGDRWGSVMSLDVWPLGGVGVSFLGAKLKLLPVEMGLGVLGHNPEPGSYAEATTPEEEQKPQPEDQAKE